MFGSQSLSNAASQRGEQEGSEHRLAGGAAHPTLAGRAWEDHEVFRDQWQVKLHPIGTIVAMALVATFEGLVTVGRRAEWYPDMP